MAFFRDLQHRYGNVVRFSFGGKSAHLVSSPSGVRQVLQTRGRQYSKDTPGIRKLKAILGEGLLTSDGATWLRQRRIAQPAFQHDKIRGFGALIDRQTDALLATWEGAAQRGETVDAHEAMMALALGIVGEALFGSDVSADAPTVAQSLDALLEIQDARFSRPYTIPLSWPLPENRRFHEAKRALDEVCFRMIAARRRDREGRDDLLSLLMNAQDADTGETMNDVQLRDEVVTVLLTGHETTANVLSFALHLLARHRDEQDRVVGALTKSFPQGLDALAVHRFPAVREALEETMRLYPPAWLFARAPLEADTLDGYAIEEGSFVFISSYVVHRMPELWPSPDAFVPSRFSHETPDRSVYFPFGLGQRQCIGAGFADLEMHAILSRVVTRFELSSPHAVAMTGLLALDPKVTLRPKGGVPIRLRRRSPDGPALSPFLPAIQ